MNKIRQNSFCKLGYGTKTFLLSLFFFLLFIINSADASVLNSGKLIPPVGLGQSEDKFGASLAFNGTYLMIGAPGLWDRPGIVYATKWNDINNWEPPLILNANDPQNGADFGYSIDIDGNLAVIGAPDADLGGINIPHGAAYVFVLNNGVWGQEAKFIHGADDYRVYGDFGKSVAISGNRIIVGAPNEAFYPDAPQGASYTGAAYIYHKIGTTWTKIKKLQATQIDDSVGASTYFGRSVDIDGDWVVVGRFGEGLFGLPIETGGVYIYHYDNSVSLWKPFDKLLPPNGTRTGFGANVKMSDGRIIVGERSTNSAYIYKFNGTGWVLETTLKADGGEHASEFGALVSISGDRALVSAPNGGNGGAGYLFERNGSTWHQGDILTSYPGDTIWDFGYPVAVHDSFAFLGGIEDDSYGVRSGSMYWYQLAGITDDWQAPYKLTGTIGFVDMSLLGLSNDGDSSCGGSSNNSDAWFLFEAPVQGLLKVNTCGSNSDSGIDTLVSLHNPADGLELLGPSCNDDVLGGLTPNACGGFSRDSAISWYMQPGTSILIRTSYYGTSIGSGTLTLNYELMPTNGNGLSGRYYTQVVDPINGSINYNENNLAMERTDPVIFFWDNFSLLNEWNPIAGVADNFGVTWNGFIRVEEPGYYVFGTISDDGSQVYIDNNLVVDNFEVQFFDWEDSYLEGSYIGDYPLQDGGADNLPGLLYLEEGCHPIEILYYDDMVFSAMMLAWLRSGANYNLGLPFTGFDGWTLAPNFATQWEIIPQHVLFTSLSACDNLDCIDQDNDGYGAYGNPSCRNGTAIDCNDDDSNIHPNADEICDGIDNNCDGAIDEGLIRATTCGLGECIGNTGIETCTNGVWNNDTCNPQEGATSEVCDDLDNDCDGEIDEGVQTTYYRDIDGDTYGNAGSGTMLACSLPSGYSINSNDCNDYQFSINPGAQEFCDGIDNNCDGEIDEGVQTTFYRDIDGDTYGNAGSGTMLTCSLPSGYSINSNDCNDNDDTIYPGADEGCDGKDTDCDGTVADTCNTPPNPGEVIVTDDTGKVTVTYDEVTEGGETDITLTDCSGFLAWPDAAICAQIDTSAEFGEAEVCLTYDESKVKDESNLTMGYCEDSGGPCYEIPPENVTIDTVNNIICTTVDHFSIFAAGEFNNAASCIANIEGNDFDIDGRDLWRLMQNYGCTGVCQGDFNLDGVVGPEDLTIFAEHFGITFCSETP